jgi:hypothetical protein
MQAVTAGGHDLMKSNVEIIQDVIEQVVNQKKIDIWDQYFSQDYISRGAPFVGMGFSVDSSGNKHTINIIAPGSPAEGKLQVGDELLWAEDEHQRWASMGQPPIVSHLVVLPLACRFFRTSGIPAHDLLFLAASPLPVVWLTPARALSSAFTATNRPVSLQAHQHVQQTYQVDIQNVWDQAQDLTGWTLVSERGNQGAALGE